MARQRVPAAVPRYPVSPNDDSKKQARERAAIGQCVDCAHARKLTSAKGSDFYRCEQSREDDTLLAYPPLPVQGCHAFFERDD